METAIAQEQHGAAGYCQELRTVRKGETLLVASLSVKFFLIPCNLHKL